MQGVQILETFHMFCERCGAVEQPTSKGKFFFVPCEWRCRGHNGGVFCSLQWWTGFWGVPELFLALFPFVPFVPWNNPWNNRDPLQ